MYFARKTTESKTSSTIFSTLCDICDISDRFTIEIREVDKIEERACSAKITDIIDDIWERRVDVCLIEFSMKWEYFDSSIGTRFLDFKLGKHNGDL